MSSKDRQFIAFAEFEPDSIEFDNPKLDVAENVTPSYGAYRPIEKLQELASLADTEPLTGGYAHLTGQATPEINLFASGEGPVAMVENWYVKDLVLIPETDDYGVDQITGPAINDTTYILTPPLDSGSAAELSLQYPETPRVPAAVTGNVKFKCRFNVQNGWRGYHQHRIDYEVLEDGAALDTPLTGTWQTAGGGETFEDFEVSFTDQNITDITANGNWDKISIHMLAEADLILADAPTNAVPVADEYYDVGWKNEDGESDDMYLSVDNLSGGYPGVPDYTTYVDSGSIPPDGESTIIFRYDELELPSDPESHGHQFMGWFTASKENMSVRMRILQADAPTDDDDPEDFWTFSGQQFRVFYDNEINNVSTDQSTPTVTELLEQLDDGYDWAQSADPTKFVYVAFTVKYAGDGGGGGTTSYLVAYDTKGSTNQWSGNPTDCGNVTDGDKSDATAAGMATTQTDEPPRSVTLKLTAGPNATSDSGHILHVLYDAPGPGDDYRFELWAGGTLIRNTGWRHGSGVGDGPAWVDVSLSTAQAASITDYSELAVVLDANSDNGVHTFSEVYFEYPGDSASARIYETYVVHNYGAAIGISDLRMTVVDPKNANIGDLNEIYVGTESNLYEATELGFTEVTRAATDYGLSADDIPKLWSFTSWGDDIIATNYADVPQFKERGTTNFVDLITSSEVPQARFCAVVAGSLVLADINPTSYADGKPFHLWCSYLLDPHQFDPADYDNQSALFPLISKSGAITGLVGGEYGWVFKRNSIWQMRYVGLPPIFQFDLIAEGVGCSHPQSIVSAGGDVYFWGGGSINRVGPRGFERLSGLRIEKYLFDTGFEERGLYNRFGNDSRENDALVWGAYDSYSGLIWWLYRNLDDGQYSIDNMVIYSVVEDRFTTARHADFDLTLLLGQQNVVSNVPVMNRGILGFQKSATTTEYVKFQGDTTYTGRLKTKILTPSTWGYPVGRDADVIAVRPMYTSQPATDVNYQPTELPDFKITVTAAQDPALRIGVETQEVRRVREDRQGWIPLDPMVGEFWQFEAEFPELNRATIKEFLGLQLLTNERGDG